VPPEVARQGPAGPALDRGELPAEPRGERPGGPGDVAEAIHHAPEGGLEESAGRSVEPVAVASDEIGSKTGREVPVRRHAGKPDGALEAVKAEDGLVERHAEVPANAPEDAAGLRDELLVPDEEAGTDR